MASDEPPATESTDPKVDELTAQAGEQDLSDEELERFEGRYGHPPFVPMHLWRHRGDDNTSWIITVKGLLPGFPELKVSRPAPALHPSLAFVITYSWFHCHAFMPKGERPTCPPRSYFRPEVMDGHTSESDFDYDSDHEVWQTLSKCDHFRYTEHRRMYGGEGSLAGPGYYGDDNFTRYAYSDDDLYADIL